jgi:formylglycine-generating enzyme
MRLKTAQLGFAVSLVLGTYSAAPAIDIETILVGNIGNVADTRFMNDGTTGYGSVAYEYRIGKYEVTNDQFAAFLNSVASNGDTYEIYEPFQMGGAYYGGILRSGGGGNYSYTVKPNMGDKPVLGVTHSGARRFVNWLHNGQPNGNQVPGITETGAYDLTGENWIPRTPGAAWFLPSENEWYKAAFYNPTGNVPGNYALYATGSLFTAPTPATADVVGNVSNPGVNVATYNAGANWNGSAPFGHITTVGSAGPLSASYYGTYDQSGNISEFTENVSIRGGSFGSLQDQLSAEVRFGNSFGGYAGLRVATIAAPDPEGGLIAYWNAENGAIDVTGNGHDGTFQDNATTIASGPFGNAFTFDGSGDYINIGDELDMVSSDFTLSAWIKGDPTMNQWGRIFDKGFASGYALGKRADENTVAFEHLASGSQGNLFDTTSNLIDNTWHHVALVKSGNTATIYADGSLENTQTVSTALQNNALPLYIGYNPGEGILGYWKGLLDELKIFDHALTLAEIQALALDPSGDLPGDYNDNGVVDTADYVVWRQHLNTSVTLPNDATAGVSPADYDVWRANFGNSSGSGTSAAVAIPEPPTAWLLSLAIMAAPGLRRDRRLWMVRRSD